MRKSMKTILAALVLATPLALTSCEGTLDDVFGEWSRPSGNTDSPPAADHSNQYLVYSYSTALDSTWTDIGDATEWNIATGDVAAGTYVVSGDFTCTGQLVLKGEVNLILKDGAKLTVDDGIVYDVTNNVGSLNIYGQGISSKMGQLIIKNNTPTGTSPSTEAPGVNVKTLTIHGGKISSSGDTGATKADASHYGLEASAITIFNGDITSRGNYDGVGIQCNGALDIYGGTINAYGGDATDANSAGNAIIGDPISIKGNAVVKAYAGAYYDTTHGGNEAICSYSTIEFSENAEVYATATDGGAAAIINSTGDITIKGKKLEATCAGSGAGIKTSLGNIEISAGTVAITTEKGPTIQSSADVDITANVTKVEMTNNVITATTNVARLFVDYAGVFKLGGTDISASWVVASSTIADVTAISNISYASKTLTYEP